jgi:ferritin-like metal-binding protein YciE
MSDIVDKLKSKVADKLETPADLLTFKLGSALKMESTVLEMLGKLESEAQRPELKEQFRHHAQETRMQIDNLRRAFGALGVEPDEKPCLPIEAIDKEGSANIKMADRSLVDAVILSGAAETEHHEIAVYESLISLAASMGRNEVVGLLRENLQQEQHTLDEVKRAMETVLRAKAGQGA